MGIQQIQEAIKSDLYSLVGKETRALTTIYWWRQLVMKRLMRNPKLRMQTLQFVDVFPALLADEAIYRHAFEYFCCAKGSSSMIGKSPLSKITATSARKLVNFIASQFMVQPEKSELKKCLTDLQGLGVKHSLDILGEAVLSEAEAECYKEKYVSLTRMLGSLGFEIDLSLKLSSLYSQFDPLAAKDSSDAVLARLDDICSAIAPLHGRITVDMEQYYFRDLTLQIFKQAVTSFHGFIDLTIALQTYLKDSEKVLGRVISIAEECGSFGIRLVKGAYWDYEVIMAKQKIWPIPVYEKQELTNESFKRNIDLALAAYPLIKTSVGSHNIDSLAYAMAKVQELRLPKDALEIQVLYGLGHPLIRPIAEMGFPLRVYIGIGNMVEGMSYLARRLLENTSQTSSAFFAQR